MFQRLFLIIIALVLLAGCATPPTAELAEVRDKVAQAYASGASQMAPEEYRIASEALAEAEQLVSTGQNRKAAQRIELAERYSALALSLTRGKKAQLERERAEREQAERRAREEAERRAREQQAREEAARKAKKVKTAPPAPKVAPAPPPPPVPKPAPEPILVDQVEVVPGETLGTISARKDVYDDILLWPIIYRANRDQIKDPKEIFPGQILLIPRDKSAEEMAAARQEALELDLFQ